MNTETKSYHFAVIGSGPAGQRAAVQAAKTGARTVLIDRRSKIGGVCLNAGTIPSKTLREAVMYLRDVRVRHFYGVNNIERANITLEDLNVRINKVLAQEYEVMESQLKRNGVELVYGQAAFENSNTLLVSTLTAGVITRIKADKILIATGTIPRRPEGIPFDQEVIFDSNFIFSSKNKRRLLPKSLIVIGAGVIGTEYASIFTALGCEVTLIDRRKDLLRFVDGETGGVLKHSLEDSGLQLVMGGGFGPITRTATGRARVDTAKKGAIEAEAVLFAMGRTSCVEPLFLENTRVSLGKHSVIEVNERFQTQDPSIYAAGDVIGFPALASTSAEQGRMAARHALGLPVQSIPSLFPIAVYTIPEISMVGKTEEELKEGQYPFVVGIARYEEIAKAAIIGDKTGMLKIIFHPETRKLLGLHIIGDLASEIVHIGQMAMALEGTIDFFINNVFNYPTLAEAYKVAALNGHNKLAGSALGETNSEKWTGT